MTVDSDNDHSSHLIGPGAEMRKISRSIFIGETIQHQTGETIAGEFVPLLGETFYKISNYDAMPPFFMSLVSSSDHWLFIGSSGGLSAGRVNADRALFPYYTVDKLTENNENTGSKTIFLVDRAGTIYLWEPLSTRQQGVYAVERNLYKNIANTTLVFEEVNLSLGLTFRAIWRMGDRFGFVKTSQLINDRPESCRLEVLDGLQNLLPANITEATQTSFSPLLDAYKLNELEPHSGLGIFILNSTLTDLAEPSESLLASTVWQIGLEPDRYLLSSQQLDTFRTGSKLTQEESIRGQRGAYFIHSAFDLLTGVERTWHLVADIGLDASAIVQLTRLLMGDKGQLSALLEEDLSANTASLEKIVACADGLQVSQNYLLASHHFANVMFNEMRGGYFPDQYAVHKDDLIDFVRAHNRFLLEKHAHFFTELPKYLSIDSLHSLAEASKEVNLIRLARSYLPLSFSRRHGDPSRPWNRFSINIKKKDGTLQLDFQGNWRDIFQNWEALATSYPQYIESMIYVFLNATTLDGYNPYRITRHGIDWELPEPNNPWSNIGYWSDHQIIYLLKLLEYAEKTHPGSLLTSLGIPRFSYANVPYRIKRYPEVLHDPGNTILFDRELQQIIQARVQETGGDGKLVVNTEGQVLHASLTEKLLTLLLAKLVNFVPEGGIWMNTQRPEWNDANNALVGKGLSVVTLAYLRRYIVFMRELLQQGEEKSLPAHAEVGAFFTQVMSILSEAQPALQNRFTDTSRRALMDALGQAGSEYRWNLYQQDFSGQVILLERAELIDFLNLALTFTDHTLRANLRADGLYHSYNILHLKPHSAAVSHLDEMLEGQVAILSSGLLTGEETLALLESLRNGLLFRADQHSYILYPDRAVRGLLQKNTLEPGKVSELALVKELVKAADESLLLSDPNGNYHFAGHIHNIKDVRRSLEGLKKQPRFSALVVQDSPAIEELFEQTFHHNQFTGRSGTFFAYEGLGSIYWHMVSKLLLAVQEIIQRTRFEPTTARLLERYRDIRLGQCFNKTPAQYGAFPTDPYSHTPAGQGAKQPGMTGMVKEEILARQAELGMAIVGGCLTFDFLFFDRSELLHRPEQLATWDVYGQPVCIQVPAGSLAYTICQTPVILQAGSEKAIEVYRDDQSCLKITGHTLDLQNSRHIFERDGKVHHLVVVIPSNV